MGIPSNKGTNKKTSQKVEKKGKSSEENEIKVIEKIKGSLSPKLRSNKQEKKRKWNFTPKKQDYKKRK